jgi:hypothetical protein
VEVESVLAKELGERIGREEGWRIVLSLSRDEVASSRSLESQFTEEMM